MSKPRIAFLGLGIMGSGMARRLLANGFPLTVFNRNAEKSKPFAAEGAQVPGSPREAAAQAEVIISMVTDDAASRVMWLGEAGLEFRLQAAGSRNLPKPPKGGTPNNGALAATKPGAVCIECSTVTVNWVRELAAAAAQKKCGFLDAPVTGSKIQSAAGELNFLVGGDAATLEKARPVLAAMSKSIIHLGPTGSGAMIKLINNFVCGVQVAALAEAIAMIERGGLDRTRALEVLTGGAPGSPLVKALSVRMTTPDFTPNFRLRLLAKDLGYAIEEGEKLSVELVTATAALEECQRAIALGHGDKDMAAVIEPLRVFDK